MSTLFDRVVRIELGQPGSTGRSIDGLRIRFKVKFSKAPEPNTAAIDVYNPSAQTVSAARAGGAVFRLLAGYNGISGQPGTVRQVFKGTAVKNGIKVTKSGVDRILHIEAQDGGDVYRLANISLSISTEVTALDLLDAVLADLEIPRGLVSAPVDARWPQGITFQGRSRDLLDRIATTQNADWFIRDGAFYLMPRGTATTETAPVYSVKRRTLIGSPVQRDHGQVEVVALLDPGMRPGRQYVVESLTDEINGTYVAGDVRMEGDSGYESAFYTTIQGRPANAAG